VAAIAVGADALPVAAHAPAVAALAQAVAAHAPAVAALALAVAALALVVAALALGRSCAESENQFSWLHLRLAADALGCSWYNTPRSVQTL
jgi:hypothetical protein